jgi:hypothetical protein
MNHFFTGGMYSFLEALGHMNNTKQQEIAQGEKRITCALFGAVVFVQEANGHI